MLGVSKALVSIVLNGKGDENGISKATQEKVLKLAEELNYKPNQFARGLKIGKSNTIGLVVSDISNQFYSKIARYIEDYCISEDYNLIICNTDENEEKEKKVIETILEKQIDGIILSSASENSNNLFKLQNENIPFILIDRKFSSFPCHYVVIDNFKAAQEATQYLIEQGHKKIACFTVSPSHISSQVDRFLGYKEAINNNSFINYNDFYYKTIDRYKMYNSILNIFRDWSNNKVMPSAILSANYQITLTILEVCREINIKIPNDLSIVSFDDIDVFRFTTPTITAVVQPLESYAKYATENLIKLIKSFKINEEQKEFIQIKLDANLVLRDSVVKYN